MPILKFLSGSALDGSTVGLTAGQGAASVGPVSKTSWGSVAGLTDIGGISISLRRPDLSYAPESIEFEVNYSGASFDTPTTAIGVTGYDQRFHDLDIVWSFGDVGTFDYLVNVPNEWKNKNVAYGAYAAHCFSTAGTYTATVAVMEPSSGKFATATVDVTIADPDVVFAGTDTLCIYPTGETAGTTPVGAATMQLDEFTSDDTFWQNDYRIETPKRILFKAGGTYAVTVRKERWTKYLFGSYETGAKPVISPATGFDSCFFTSGNPGTRYQGLEFSGNYDPALGSRDNLSPAQLAGLDLSAIGFGPCPDCVVDDCVVSGFGAFSISNNAGSDRQSFHVSNTSITDFGGSYPILWGTNTNANSTFVATGLHMVQKSDAPSEGIQFKAPIRHNGTDRLHIRSCDMFMRDSTQTTLKLFNAYASTDVRYTIHSCYLEGGVNSLDFGGNNKNLPDGASPQHNGKISGILSVGATSSITGLIASEVMGLTVESCLHIQPATDKVNQSHRFFASFNSVGLTAETASAPITCRNNTFVSLRTIAQNQNTGVPEGPAFGQTIGVEPTIVAGTFVNENNIIHLPNMSLASEFAPFDTTAFAFDARNIGFIPQTTPGIENVIAGTASPSNSLAPYSLATGSTGLGAATGSVAVRDILGVVKYGEGITPDIGAYQVST